MTSPRHRPAHYPVQLDRIGDDRWLDAREARLASLVADFIPSRNERVTRRQGSSRCAECGARLARDNPGPRCGPCDRAGW